MESKNFVDRNEEAEQFCGLLENTKKDNWIKNNLDIKSYNICLDARWGDGKSTFINNSLVPKIKDKELYNGDDIILISAWNYDYLDDPIELIFDILSKNQNMKEKVIGVFTELAKSFFIDSPLFPEWLKWPIKNCIIINDNKKNEFSNVLKMNKLIEAIEKGFNSTKKGNSIDKYKYLIIIEDLDRCKPEFAKKLFEIIKHVFNSELFIVIFVCDWNLINSMMTTHHILDGYNELYLDRIVDSVFSLQKIDISQYFFTKYLSKINGNYSMSTLENVNIGSSNNNVINNYVDNNYFHYTLQDYSLRDQNINYHKLMIMLNRQQKYFDNKFILYPELYNFLFENFLEKKARDKDNIFNKYFYEKSNNFKKNEMYFIIESIIYILKIIESKAYTNFDKRNIQVEREIYVWDIFSNFDSTTWGNWYNLEIKVFINEMEYKYALKKHVFFVEVFPFLKKEAVLELLNNWFAYEINKH